MWQFTFVWFCILKIFIFSLSYQICPLVKYIYEEIDTILDVKHLEQVFLVSKMEDKHVLWGTARNFNIDSPEVIQCNFATRLIEEGWLISIYESVPVMNL